MKKKVWAGVVSGEIQFFSQNPQGNVEGLQGYRQFNVTDQCTLVDDHGTNILSNTASGAGAQSADIAEVGSGEQQNQTQTPPQTA